MNGPEIMRDPADYITFDEAERILNTATDIRDKAIIGLLWRAGLRAHEIGLLRKKYLIVEDRAMIVLGKGNKLKRMPMEPELFGWLTQIADISALNDEDFIFRGRSGKGLSRKTVWYIVRKYSEQSGVLVTHANRPVHPHCFRHSLAIWLVKMGIPVPKIQQILRHSSLSSTTYYTQFSQTELAESFLDAWQRAREVMNIDQEAITNG